MANAFGVVMDDVFMTSSVERARETFRAQRNREWLSWAGRALMPDVMAEVEEEERKADEERLVEEQRRVEEERRIAEEGDRMRLEVERR
jgi:hypothetical protein